MYSREETISSEGFFQSKVEVCVVEEETNYGQQLNGVTLNDGIYEVELHLSGQRACRACGVVFAGCADPSGAVKRRTG